MDESTLAEQPETIWNKLTGTPLFKSANEFSMYIESSAVESNTTYIEALLNFCADHMLEPEDVASEISRSLKDKLAMDFKQLNMLPKTVELEF